MPTIIFFTVLIVSANIVGPLWLCGLSAAIALMAATQERHHL
jgi:hypothetical protein